MLPVYTVVGGLIGVVFTALVTAYLGKRKSSGDVETSEAKDLWDTLRGELARLQTEATSLRSEVASGRSEMNALRSEATTLRSGMVTLQADLLACHTKNQELLEQLERRVKSRGRSDT